MKKFIRFALVMMVGALMWGCASENSEQECGVTPEVQTAVEAQAAEDAAFAELFRELDAVNAQYFDQSANASYVVGPDTPKKITRAFKVLACDAMGALLGGAAFGPYGAGVGAVAASTWAAFKWEKLDNLILKLKFNVTLSCEAYLSGVAYDGYDELGLAHNTAIESMLNKYTLDNISGMTLNQLQPVVLSSLQNSGYVSFPPNYNSQYIYTVIQNVQTVLNKNSYDALKSVDYISLANPTFKNDCQLVKAYLTSLNSVSDANLVSWHRSYRTTIQNSSIPLSSKQMMRSCMSIGLASSNLWYYSE